MSITVQLPTALRPYVDRQAAVSLEGKTVADVLDRLTVRYSALKPHLMGPDGNLRSFVNVYLNDSDVRDLQGGQTPVKDGDTLLIVPAIAGGSDCGPAGSCERGELSADEIKRYSRHLIMPEVGVEGQKKLRRAKVLLVGAGGLGAPAGLYLAAAGVGTLGLVDFDLVDESNLQRQVLFSTASVGRPKIQEAKARLVGLNPLIEVRCHETRLTSQNALPLFSQYDMVLDGTDNFPTRYLVNDACVLAGKPNVYASIFRFEGQVSVFDAKSGPCYRCLYPEPPPPGLVPSCAEGGVLGVLPGVVGALQALQAIKLIVGIGETMIGKLLLFDALTMTFRKLALRKSPGCPLCGPKPTVTKLVDYEQFCGVSRGEPQGDAVPEITVEELKSRMDRNEPFVLVDVREAHEYEICRIPTSLLLPLGELPKRVSELDRTKPIVVHCKSGALRENGFLNAVNLSGGIRAWSERVDRSVPTY